jgi:F-type H+-transporting ATPase subunit b
MKKGNQNSETGSKRLKLISFVFLAVSFAFLSIASASGGEEAVPLWRDYLWKIINFGILFAVLYKFGKKPIASFLKQRTELIEKTLKEAKEAKELAQKALQEVEERFKTKDKEIAEILSISTHPGEEVRDRLIDEGNSLKEKIFEQAKVNIDYELKHAKEAIKAEAVEVAMELAEKKLKEKLTKTEQERLLEESLMKIGGKG